MAAQECLDLAGVNTLPAPANQVPLPSDDHQVARRVVAAQVSGSKPSVCSPRFAGSGLVAEVSSGAARSASPDLTGFSSWHVVPRVVHQAKLRISSSPADGVESDLRRVFRR